MYADIKEINDYVYNKDCFAVEPLVSKAKHHQRTLGQYKQIIQ